MKFIYPFLIVLILNSLAFAQAPPRFVAVTIDDLPVVGKQRDVKFGNRVTKNLLRHIKKAEVPAIGFVNEQKLYADGKRIKRQINYLEMWLENGLELGNHTYSHKSLHTIPLEEYQADILKGELITKELLEKNGLTMRYFRHPFLNTGMSLEIKKGLDEFLNKYNYIIAPVSIDNSDWAFARAYDVATDKKNKKLKKRIGEAYVPYLEAKTDYWERQSVRLFNREIKQTLLLHANSINADYFDDVAKMYKKRGYQFITLEEALKDEAYKLPDTFVGRAGISWLHRWALGRGKENIIPNEPKVPKFVMDAAGLKSE